MKNYRIVNTCAVCDHHMTLTTNEELCCFCNFDQTFKEEYFYNFLLRGDVIRNAREWRVKHIVGRNGICDDFRNKDK